LGDVITSSTAGLFEINNYAINPGVSDSFPWLSALASNFEQYAFAGLIFEYISNSGDAITSANTALGKVILATDYNAANMPFGTEQEMLITEFSNFNKPSQNILHAVECDPKMRPQLLNYVRVGPPPASTDIKTYDLGNTSVATVGMQGTSVNVGALWVSYDVFLCKPVLSALAGSHCAHMVSQEYTNANPIAGLSQLAGNITMTVLSNKLTFPANVTSGNYLLTMDWQGTAQAVTVQPVLTLTNCSAIVAWNGDTNVSFTNAGDLTKTLTLQYALTVTGRAPSIVFGAATLPGAAVWLDLVVSQLDTTYS